MSQGGSTDGGGLGFGSTLLAFANPRVATALQGMRAGNIANQSAQMDLDTKRAREQTWVDQGLRPDPKTGIQWDGPRYGEADPLAPIRKDPMSMLAAKLDPQGTLSTIFSRAMAPPSNFRVTGPDGQAKSQMLTPSQAMNMQGQGYQIEELDKAKPVDPNQPPTFVTAAGANNREQSYMWRPGMQSPTPFGAPGKLVNPPMSDLGKLQFDMSNSFGGGRMIPGQQGSGAPPANAPTVATPPAQAGGGTFGPSSAAPLIAAPVYDPVAATDRSTVRRPWLTPPAQTQPGAAAPGIPSVADAFTAKMIAASRTPEDQAGLNAAAEESARAAAKASSPEYLQAQAEKRAKLQQAYESSTGGLDETMGVIDKMTHPDNSEGLGDITGFGGTFLGRQFTLPGSGAGRMPVLGTAKGLPASDMEALSAQLEAKSFLGGLAELKSQSSTGASGLGAVSETEGKRVIQAQAALDRSQSQEGYTAALLNYRKALASAKENVRKAYESEMRASGGPAAQPQGRAGGWSIERVN